MDQLLNTGQRIQGDSSGLSFKIVEYVGGGSQGEVYRASTGKSEVAVKWFYPRYIRQDQRLRERLERSIQIGAPSDCFLWPIELAIATATEGFGYIMNLREPRFRGMAELVTRQVEPTFRALATAGFELANSFLQLHALGLCYRDISFGNISFDPATGEIQICDNDNVDIDGQPGSIGGTVRFMAPELVMGTNTPTTQSDLFSLAILLFYLLINHHPLEGKRESEIHCFDLPAMTRLYGSEALFIFDPANKRNHPVPGLHDNAMAFWPVYPHFLHALFIRAFTDGIQNTQQGRIRESEWRAAMNQLRDSIFYCTACGAENFYDAEVLRPNGGAPQLDGACWACSRPLHLPPRIRISQGSEALVVMLNHDTQLFSHHLVPGRTWNFDKPLAEMRRHPQNPSSWGLTNLSTGEWTARTASADIVAVPPGRSVTLSNGVKIQFGSSEGEVRT